MTARLFDLYLGAEASPARLAGDLKAYSIVHLAAHGYVDREFPQRSGIALAFTPGHDGYFTIANTLDVDLDANLVVLSACETGQGEVLRGEGVQSLARAFLYAGARGVVASLWPVDDRATAELMESLYRRALGQDPSLPQALREAKLEVRRKKEVRGIKAKTAGGETTSPFELGHPYFWAPFIYVGLPR
jgi:CHAT domain-containing protein